MSTPSIFSIPTIDLSNLQNPSDRQQVVEKIHDACVTSGFFQLIGHGVAKELQNAVFAGAESLFALPLEEKKELDMKNCGGRGYELFAAQSLSASQIAPDQKEGFYIGREIPFDHFFVRKGTFLIGPNQWPPQLPRDIFRNVMEEYYDCMMKLSRTVLELIESGLEKINPQGLDFEGIYCKNETIDGGEDIIASLRLLHYPPKAHAEIVGAGPHTDFGFITLLLQDSIGGLEVLSPTDEKTWYPVPPNPDAYVVNIGDMLQMFTNGRFKSSMHRVVLEEGRGDRYSIPFFFDGKAGFVLRGEDNEEELTVEGYMRQRFSGTYKN